MVNLVIASKHFETLPTHQRIRMQLLEQRKVDSFLQEHVSCLLITHNNGLADIVKSSDSATDIIRGDGYYHESLTLQMPDTSSQALFRVSPFAFFQTNTLGAELLFSTALTMLPQITGNVVDLYCGSGTIGISCLKAGIGKKLKGIEIVAEAIRDAEHNSQLNGLQEQTTFFVGKAEEVINQANIEDILIGNDLIIVDPPREGLHPSMIGFLHTLKQQY
jgi:23S rRNA (uracil1939-C5)-methyltransferase